MTTKKRRLNGDGSFKKRKNGTWEYRISLPGQYDKNGNQIRISAYGKTRAEAREKAKVKINLHETGTVKSKEDMTISDLADQILEDRLSQGVIQEQTYARHLETIKRLEPIGNIKASQATAGQIKEFLKTQRKYSDSSITKEFQLLKAVFREAQKRKIVSENIMNDISCPKSSQIREDVRGFTLDEEKQFINVLNTYDVKYSDVMLVSLFTGLRCGEVLALSPNDVDVKNKILHVNKTVSRDKSGTPFINRRTKTYAGKRDLRINDELCSFLAALLPNANGSLIFTDANGNIVSTNTVNAHFSALMKKYNIEKKIDGKKITLHSLRHTYATRCIESGMPAKVLQHRLGHKSITVTYNTYADVFDHFEDTAIETADKYLADKGVQMGYSTPKPPKK